MVNPDFEEFFALQQAFPLFPFVFSFFVYQICDDNPWQELKGVKETASKEKK
jgi:hypothetical protein